jgi:hypothetical protein
LPDNSPNPPTTSTRRLLIPWALAACLFTVSIITAMITMIQGMAYARDNQGVLPSWYHSLMTLSQVGLFLSTAAILILVAISLRRAFKSK